jgi:hypothetical protein
MNKNKVFCLFLIYAFSYNAQAFNPIGDIWNNPKVTYTISRSDFTDCEIDAINTAFYRWSSVRGSKLRLIYNGLTDEVIGPDGGPQNESHLVIRIKNLGPDADYAAVTRPKGLGSGTFEDSDIIFNGDIQWNCSSRPPILWLFKFDIQSIALHEIGHFIGLAHPHGDKNFPSDENRESVVEPIKSGEKWRRLFPDDKAGARFLYPKRRREHKAPSVVYVDPISGDWTSSPKTLSVTSDGAGVIYYTMANTYDGSTPPDPDTPSPSSNNGSISGPSGTFVLYGAGGQYKRSLLRFIGCNSNGCGPASPVFSYAINLSGGSGGGGSGGSAPSDVAVAPASGSWISSPQWINVSAGNAERIYCTLRTTLDGSEPETPPEPTIESHDPCAQGVDYIGGSSGQFQFYAESDQNKRLKARFRGYNGNGYGPSSSSYAYVIDRTKSTPTPGNLPNLRVWSVGLFDADGNELQEEKSLLGVGNTYFLHVYPISEDADATNGISEDTENIETDIFYKLALDESQDGSGWRFLARVYTRPSTLKKGDPHKETVPIVITEEMAGNRIYFKAKVDATEEVKETNEDDNWSDQNKEWYPVQGRCDLTAFTVRLTNSRTTLNFGDHFGLEMGIKNIGSSNCPGETRSYYYLMKPGETSWSKVAEDGTDAAELTPGREQWEVTLNEPFQANAVGTYQMMACADANNANPETDEDNNCITSSFEVSNNAPDFIISNLGLKEGTVIKKDSIVHPYCIIRNIGTATPSSGIRTAYYIDDVYRADDGSDAGELTPGRDQYEEVLNDDIKLGKTGNRTLKCCADYQGAVLELDESNNCASLGFTVQ